MVIVFLYQILFPDGRGYIGVTRDVKRRFSEHKKPRTAIGKEIRRVGFENVSFRVLLCGEHDFIYEMERRAIAAYGTRSPSGFNLYIGGISGRGSRDPLPSTREKRAKAMKGRPGPMTGKRFTEEHRANLGASVSEAKRGKPLHPNFVAASRATNTGRSRPDVAERNKKPQSDETKAKRVASMEKWFQRRRSRTTSNA